jgi:hypothetical protein
LLTPWLKPGVFSSVALLILHHPKWQPTRLRLPPKARGPQSPKIAAAPIINRAQRTARRCRAAQLPPRGQ